jgi:hypothetical protein
MAGDRVDEAPLGVNVGAVRSLIQDYRSTMESSGIGRVMAGYREAMAGSGIRSLMQDYRTAMEGSGIGRVMEDYRAAMESSGIRSLMQNYRATMEDSGIRSLMEGYRTSLGGNGVRKSLGQYQQSLLKSFSEDWESGSDVSESVSLAVDDILEELQARQLAPSASPPQKVPLEGAAVITISAALDGKVIKPERSWLVDLPVWRLMLLLHLLTASVYLVCNWEAARQGLVDINARLPLTDSFAELRNYIRTELASKPGDIRIVTGRDVRLRDGPSMKSEVLLELPKQATVAVLGKASRGWRFVSYEHDGYVIDGYVSTKFLRKIRKR